MPIPVTVYLRSVLGVNLTPTQADLNISNLRDAIDELDAAMPVAADTISNITVDGTQFTVHMLSGATFGPFDLPVGTFTPQDVQEIVYEISDDAYTLTDADVGKHFICTNVAGCVVTVPAVDVDMQMIIGTINRFTQTLDGAPITFVEGGTGTEFWLPRETSLAQTDGIYTTVWMKLVLTDVWLFGPASDLVDSASSSAVITASSTTFTPDVSHEGKYIRCTHASGCTVTIVDDDAGWGEGVEMNFRVAPGAGAISIVGDSGVTINGVTAFYDETAAGVEGATITLKHVTTNEWDLIGGPLEPV